MGGAMGSLLGEATEEDEATLLGLVRAKLEKGSSAIVFLADAPYVETLIASTRDGAKEVYEQPVREELRNRLDEALREAALQVPPPQQQSVRTPPPVMH